MARTKRPRVHKRFVYFFLNGKLHKVIKSSRSKDEIIAWCYPDRKRVLYSYSQVEKYKESAYSLTEVGKLIGRHKVTVEEYVIDGKVREPQKVYPIGKPESNWYKYMMSESDVLDLHQFILDAGYSKNLPSRAELQALLKHNMILYTKSSEGNFVPVWKAE
jgi:hypothetical protein